MIHGHLWSQTDSLPQMLQCSIRTAKSLLAQPHSMNGGMIIGISVNKTLKNTYGLGKFSVGNEAPSTFNICVDNIGHCAASASFPLIDPLPVQIISTLLG